MSRKNASKFKMFPPDKEIVCCNICKNIPYFPKFESECICKDRLRVTWFESSFSQSRYNFENTTCGSNACTLIAVLMAANCNFNKIKIEGPKYETNDELIHALALSIVMGNSLHENLRKNGLLTNINLTVPEAMKYSGNTVKGLKEWGSELYYEPLSMSLFDNIKCKLKEWRLKKRNFDLYVVLICDSRSVLFVIQNNCGTITLIDSHQHSRSKGAVIATVNGSKLKILCQWYSEMIFNYYHSHPQMYELAFLFFTNEQASNEKINK